MPLGPLRAPKCHPRTYGGQLPPPPLGGGGRGALKGAGGLNLEI